MWLIINFCRSLLEEQINNVQKFLVWIIFFMTIPIIVAGTGIDTLDRSLRNAMTLLPYTIMPNSLIHHQAMAYSRENNSA